MLRPNHVDLFDEILIDLVPHAELVARPAELAERLSLISNAPRVLVGRARARERDHGAGPLLRRSPVLDEETAARIARVKGQGHLLAMTSEPSLVGRSHRRHRRARATAGDPPCGPQMPARCFSESGIQRIAQSGANQDGVLDARCRPGEICPTRG